MLIPADQVRELVDKIFSLQWCRENLVVPINQEPVLPPNPSKITIAIGNFSYLATIGEFIKRRVGENGFECQFVEKPADEIQALLDLAAQARIISGEVVTKTEFNDDAILDALKEADEDSNSGFNFDFDSSEEEIIEETTEDLSMEMMGSKIQQAAAKILIHSCRSGVSDIHVEPRQDDYNIRVRRDGVMQNYVKIPRSAGIKLTACLKNMASMDIERRASQDGKIKRRFEGQTMEFAALQHQENMAAWS